MIKAILFDWAGVIAADGYWTWLRENVKDIESKKPFFQKLSEKVDIGKMSQEEFERTIAEYSNVPQNKIWPGVREKIIINTEIVDLIKTLKKRYKVALLSNFVYGWLHEILVTNNLYEIFDETIISSQHGIIKPQKEIFQKMLDLLMLKKNEVIFIDDRQMHIDGATRFGIKALLFTSTDKLIQDLSDNGIKIN
jgi:HAD superfamily hydrolase (TIGR01509 family)